MALSVSVLRDFVKQATKNDSVKSGDTLSGTIKAHGKALYVQLDGSDQLTPYASSTAGVKDGDRVLVQVKDHRVTVLGNTSDVAFTASEGEAVKESIVETNQLIADSVRTTQLEAAQAYIKKLTSDQATIDKLKSGEITVDELTAEDVAAGTITAEEAKVINFYAASGSFDSLIADYVKTSTLEANYITANDIKSTYATIESLDATNASVDNLEATKADIESLEAAQAYLKTLAADEATIESLKAGTATIDEIVAAAVEAGTIDAETANVVLLQAQTGNFTNLVAKFADLDLANISSLAAQNFYAKAGTIEYVTAETGVVTKKLTAVEVDGDLITANTLKADKLVVKGQDGLYYRLNTDGVSVAEEQTDENSLNGSVITAKSVTADKITVSDIAAFNATIGGMVLTDGSLHSVNKGSADVSATSGFYMDAEGQLCFGNNTDYIRFYKDASQKWQLDISTASLTVLNGLNNFITYDGENITIKGEGSDLRLVLGPEGIYFRKDDTTDVAYITGDMFHIQNGVLTDELHLGEQTDTGGSWVWKKRANEHLGLKYYGPKATTLVVE